MQRWSPATCERLRQAPVVPGAGPRPDSPTLEEDEELLELTGRRGFPLLAGAAFGYPAARAVAPSTAASECRGGRRLFAWDRWKGALYLDGYGHLDTGPWREHVTLLAHVRTRAGRSGKRSNVLAFTRSGHTGSDGPTSTLLIRGTRDVQPLESLAPERS